MKKQLFASIVLGGIVGSAIVFAQAPLSSQFTELTEQIITQSTTPFATLEQLKSTISQCAKQHTESVVQSACAEWLSGTYQKIKEATPQQIYVEIGTGEVYIKKIGEKSYYNASNYVSFSGDLYEISIPKYGFKIQIPIQKGEAAKKALAEWKWSRSGMISLPTNDLAHRVGRQIALFSFPYFNSNTSLTEVGKVYRKLYEDIFCLKDWKGLIEKNTPDLRTGYKFEYIIKEGELPSLQSRTPKIQGDGWYGALYPTKLFDYYGGEVRDQYANALAHGWIPQDEKKCKALHEKKRNKDWWDVYLLRNKYTPNYFWMWMFSLSSDPGTIIDK